MATVEALVRAAESGDIEKVRGILVENPDLGRQRDEKGATALHYAALGGHRALVQLLVEHGADINATDSEFGATPAGWAIEYLRELGGYLAYELQDFTYAIEKGDVPWAKRFLQRYPGLREANDKSGKPFKELAVRSGNPEIIALFR